MIYRMDRPRQLTARDPQSERRQKYLGVLQEFPRRAPLNLPQYVLPDRLRLIFGLAQDLRAFQRHLDCADHEVSARFGGKVVLGIVGRCGQTIAMSLLGIRAFSLGYLLRTIGAHSSCRSVTGSRGRGKEKWSRGIACIAR